MGIFDRIRSGRIPTPLSPSGGGTPTTPGGADTQVQYNDGGSFGGSSGFIYLEALKSVSIGNDPNPNTITGVDSLSVGYGNTNSQDYTYTFGENNTASGFDSMAVGNGCIASGTTSFAQGQSQAQASNAVALNGSTANGEFSLAASGGTANGNFSACFGQSTTANADRQFVIGIYNIPSGTPGAPAASDEVFQIGIGTGVGNEQNALAVTRDGAVLPYIMTYRAAPAEGFLVGGFTLNPNQGSYKVIDSGGAVTSSLTTAISDGLYAGQLLVLHNSGGFNITLANGANTVLPGAADYTIAPNGTISLIWNNVNWITIAASVN